MWPGFDKFLKQVKPFLGKFVEIEINIAPGKTKILSFYKLLKTFRHFCKILSILEIFRRKIARLPGLSGKFSDSIAQSRVQLRPGAWSNQSIRTKLLTLSKGAHFKNALALCARP